MAGSFDFRVAWFDCDPAGIVFYPRVLAYMNEAAHAYLEQCGFPLSRLAERGVIGVPMVSLSIEYTKVLKLGDRARIETDVTDIGRSSIRFAHKLFVGQDAAASAKEVRVYAGRADDGAIAATPVPEDVRAALLARQ